MLTWRVSALPVAAALAVTLAAFLRLRRTWPDAGWPGALVLPLAVAAALAGGPLTEAGASSARSLAALRAEPFLLPDPARRDTLFHVLAWAPALALGDEAAVRVVAGGAAGSALLLACALARSAVLGAPAGLVAQAALAALVVALAGPGRAAYAHALPQALVLLLLAHLARRLAHLEGARDTAAAFAYLTLAQAAGPGPTLEVALLVGVLATAETLAGHRRRALRLATSWAASAAVVLAVRHAPVLLAWPALVETPAPAPAPLVPLALAALAGALGVAALPAATAVRRVLASALGAALATFVIAGVIAPGATLPGLALLAPAAACGLAALAQRLSSATSAAPAPGSRS